MQLRVQIDLPAADPERITAQMSATFDIDPGDVLRVSAKTGEPAVHELGRTGS